MPKIPKALIERFTNLMSEYVEWRSVMRNNNADKKMKSCMLIDLAVPYDRNTSVTVAEKLSKCKDLEIEIARMW